MPNYRRSHTTGGTFFFTLVTNDRIPLLKDQTAVELLLKIIDETRIKYPFEMIAYCILPDHLHSLWSLPEGDDNFSIRWQTIKARFSIEYKKISNIQGHISDSKLRKRESGIWQRRFWEHTIRDDVDFSRHIDYIHYNPFKHRLVTKLIEWPWSSYHRFLHEGYYDQDWGVFEPRDILKSENLE